MKITVGITTFNRKNYLVKLQQSLSMSQNIKSCNIRIYDDCSTEFSIRNLKRLFPNALEIIRRDKNVGADRNMRQMYVDFLTTNDDILVTMDSDLICRPDWIDFTEKQFDYTEGIMSLYNSYRHKPTNTLIMNGHEFLEKEHIGAAGSIMSRDIVCEIVENLSPSDSFDWDWSAFLRRKGIRILVSKESYFQHIGLQGYNCDGIKKVEFGLNFNPVNNINRKFLKEYYQEYLTIIGDRETRSNAARIIRREITKLADVTGMNISKSKGRPKKGRSS